MTTPDRASASPEQVQAACDFADEWGLRNATMQSLAALLCAREAALLLRAETAERHSNEANDCVVMITNDVAAILGKPANSIAPMFVPEHVAEVVAARDEAQASVVAMREALELMDKGLALAERVVQTMKELLPTPPNADDVAGATRDKWQAFTDAVCESDDHNRMAIPLCEAALADAQSVAQAHDERVRDEMLVALDDPALLEVLADAEHQRWAAWMRYQQTAPEEKRAGWPRKAALVYWGLTDEEQESDRIEARKTLAIIRNRLAAIRARTP